MKTRLGLFLLAAVAMVSAADTIPIVGKWQIYIKVADREAEDFCTIEQNKGELTGTCTSERGSSKLTGKVDATDSKKVTFTHSGDSVTLTYSGMLSKAADDSPFLSGTVTVEEYGVVGEFSASQIK